MDIETYNNDDYIDFSSIKDQINKFKSKKIFKKADYLEILNDFEGIKIISVSGKHFFISSVVTQVFSFSFALSTSMMMTSEERKLLLFLLLSLKAEGT